jgi:hypothetical protein
MDKRNIRAETTREDRSAIIQQAMAYRHNMKMSAASPFRVNSDKTPPGMTLKFVRAKIGNEVDTENLRKHAEAYWTPCSPERYPEFKGNQHLAADDPFKNNVFLAGMILMERPVEFRDAELSVYRERTNQAMHACPLMDEYRDPRMPVFVGENSYRTPGSHGSFGFSD